MSKINIFVATGGLGNQLFQIAAACNFAIRYKKKVYLDTRSFYSNSNFKFELDDLVKKLRENKIYIENEVPILLRLLVKIRKIFAMKYFFFINLLVKIINESQPYQYQDLNKHSSLISIFVGYWQSEKHFIKNKNLLKKIYIKFFNKFYISTNNKKKFTKSKFQKILVHLRFGDYLCIDGYAALDINYYKNAISYMKKKFGKCRFIAFSDDYKLLKKQTKNIHIDDYFDDRGMNSKKVLSFMLSCDHFILANSSFSWWAAYLGKNNRKITIAPKKWIPLVKYTPDLIPGDWLKMKNNHIHKI